MRRSPFRKPLRYLPHQRRLLGSHVQACGQHLSATRDQIGETAPCPNCNAEVMVPVQSTLAPPLPRFSPQPQEPAQNPKSASIKRRSTQISWKAAAVIILVATIVIVAGMSQSIKDQPRREAERRAANRESGYGIGEKRKSPRRNDCRSMPHGVGRTGSH